MGQSFAEDERPTIPRITPATFEGFVRQERDALVGFLRRRIGAEEDAQDVAQESFARLIRYRSHEPDEWRALLYRIAINALNDRIRRQQTQHAADHVSFDEEVHRQASSEQSHDQRVATQQQLAQLQRALLRLPKRCREIYLLNRIEDMSYVEIARHRCISVKAVEKQISKALTLLRKLLDVGNAGWPSP